MTPREKEVLRLAAEGASEAETASVLSISRQTVKTHRKAVYAKLGARGVADAVARAFRAGMLT